MTSAPRLSRRHPCRFSTVISRYLQNITTCLFYTSKRMLRTIIMQNSRLIQASFPIKIDEFWIDRFWIRYDWRHQCPQCGYDRDEMMHSTVLGGGNYLFTAKTECQLSQPLSVKISVGDIRRKPNVLTRPTVNIAVNKIDILRDRYHIFNLQLTPGFNGLGKDNSKTIEKYSSVWDCVCLILEFGG